MDVEFYEGRAVWALDHDLWLSVINRDREPMLRAALARDPVWAVERMFYSDDSVEEVVKVAADDESWEVALITDALGSLAVPEFDGYLREDTSDDNWAIYGNVPIPVVMAYVEANDGRLLPQTEWPDN